MRITLFTIGARGDTQPFVALAVRLKQDGHSVKFAARPDFAGLAADCGVDFAPLGHPYQSFITGAGEASAIGPGHLLTKLRYGLSQRRYFFDQLDQDAWRAAQGAEAIIYKSSWITGYSIAEKLGIPCAGAMLFPLTPTRVFPNFLLGGGKAAQTPPQGEDKPSPLLCLRSALPGSSSPWGGVLSNARYRSCGFPAGMLSPAASRTG